MSNVKITDFSELTEPAGSDLLEIVDVSANSNKKIKYENLFGTPSAGGWNDLNDIPDTVTANGNRSYDLVFNTNDLTDTVSAGMRLQLTRTVTAPTRCTDLNGTTQYFNKSSPSGCTFTDDFTIMAWVKIESYDSNAANIRTILSRRNAAVSGFGFAVRANGQVTIYGGTGSAFDVGSTYSSIPIGRWVHVAGTLDMSGTTSTIYVDGVSQTVGYTNSAATSITQSGDLIVGSVSGSSEFMNGKIAQVGLFNAVLSQATIRSYMSQGLSGSETSLVSAYSLNNSITDLNTTNANNLTAQASAVATNVDSPFSGADFTGNTAGTTEMAIVTKTAFSTNTTLTVQVPEGYAIPTSGGISAVLYSTHKMPYGFPAQPSKWRLNTLMRTTATVTSNATYGAFQSGGFNLMTPIGDWNVGWRGAMLSTTTTTVYFNLSSTALTGLTAAQGLDTSNFVVEVKSSAAANYTFSGFANQQQSISTASTYVMYTLGATTSASLDVGGVNEIFAEFNYL